MRRLTVCRVRDSSSFPTRIQNDRYEISALNLTLSLSRERVKIIKELPLIPSSKERKNWCGMDNSRTIL